MINKKNILSFILSITAFALQAQKIRFELVGYDADILMEKGKLYEHRMPTHYDAKGKRQGPVAINMYYKNGLPPVCLFRSNFKDDVLVDSAVWYFRSGAKRMQYQLSPDTAGSISISGDSNIHWYLRYEDLRSKKQGTFYEWRENTPNGSTYLSEEKHFCNNNLCDSMISYFDNGKVFQKTIFDANYELKSEIRYHKDGRIACRQLYVNGKREGALTMFHENGKKSFQVNYKNDNREGIQQEWFPNGKTKSTGFYINDQLAGHYREFDSLGRKTIYRHYSSTTFEMDSVEIAYYPSGKIKSRTEFTEGDGGLHKAWWPNGQLAAKGDYRKGSEPGNWTFFDAAGAPLKRYPDLNPPSDSDKDNTVDAGYHPIQDRENYNDGYLVFWGYAFSLPDLPLVKKTPELQPADQLKFLTKYPVIVTEAIIDNNGMVTFVLKTKLPPDEEQLLLNWLTANASGAKPFEHFSKPQQSTITFHIITTE